MRCYDWTEQPALGAVRYQGDKLVLKAGMLPFYRDNSGALHFLVHAPNPIRNPEDVMPFQIARGTREPLPLNGKKVKEIREDYAAARRHVEAGGEFEPAQSAALREAEEELGLPPANIGKLFDCGVLAYKDYGIHFFAAEVREKDKLSDASEHSREVRWVTLEEARRMADVEGAEGFNPGYLPLLDAMAGVVAQQRPPP